MCLSAGLYIGYLRCFLMSGPAAVVFITSRLSGMSVSKVNKAMAMTSNKDESDEKECNDVVTQKLTLCDMEMA